jgi:hypothetical protein
MFRSQIRPGHRGGVTVARLASVTARGRSARGQTTTEWLMIAGLLTAVALAVFDFRRPWTMSGVLIYVGQSMFTYLRTMAP